MLNHELVREIVKEKLSPTMEAVGEYLLKVKGSDMSLTPERELFKGWLVEFDPAVMDETGRVVQGDGHQKLVHWLMHNSTLDD